MSLIIRQNEHYLSWTAIVPPWFIILNDAKHINFLSLFITYSLKKERQWKKIFYPRFLNFLLTGQQNLWGGGDKSSGERPRG